MSLEPQRPVTAPTRAVWKFPLASSGVPCVVQMPAGAFIVHVHEQDDRPTLWAEVNTCAPMVDRHFIVLATGEPVPPGLSASYIGTIHIGWTVWHVYEVTSG